MNERKTHSTDDPLGLRDLPLLEPDRDGWSEVRAALEADAAPGRRARVAPWLAVAACAVLAVAIVMLRPDAAPPGASAGPAVADATEMTHATEASAENPAPGEAAPPAGEELDELIALSQILEQRLRALRDNTGAMPADATVYVAELEDLVAQVDDRLGQEPDSIDLWGQRVNLLLDLEYLYQHQFDRQYGRMASL